MPRVVAFDVYGTVIDLDGLIQPLEEIFGTRARKAARLWREKQIEYTFRRALMRRYANFEICTAQVLTCVAQQMGADFGDAHRSMAAAGRCARVRSLGILA